MGFLINNTTQMTFNKVYWAPRALKSASWDLALKPIMYNNNSITHSYTWRVPPASWHLSRVYTIIIQYTGNTWIPRYSSLSRGNTHFPRTWCLARGKHPHYAHLSLARSQHPRRPQGFGSLPISRPGLGKLPTRQSMSFLWTPYGLILNTQLGLESPYV